MSRRIIAGNWKMNTTVEEGRALAAAMKDGLDAVEEVDSVLCPPFVALEPVSEVIRGTRIALGAQNMHYEASGAYTGEVSVQMLTTLCRYVIVGHSERRHLLGETDEVVGKKARAAVDAGLTAILCVGETLEERTGGQAEATVERQVKAGVAGLATHRDLVVAYEPVWAIGTGEAASPDDAQAMAAHVRSLLEREYGGRAYDVPILYGGSVNDANVGDFVSRHDVDGALVGSASLDAEGFVDLVRNAAAAT